MSNGDKEDILKTTIKLLGINLQYVRWKVHGIGLKAE